MPVDTDITSSNTKLKLLILKRSAVIKLPTPSIEKPQKEPSKLMLNLANL